MKTILFTVTNHLVHDQRMHRIAGSLANNGFNVVLVGRRLSGSPPLSKHNFKQHRIRCFFSKGIIGYAEYNLRLLVYLLFHKADLVGAIDLDTIIPCYISSVIKQQQRVYDAHELFTEQIEIIRRPRIKKIWLWVEKTFVPRFPHGYTVNDFIAQELYKRYHVSYAVIRNLPILTPLTAQETTSDAPFLIYQGAVNEGRCFETLIPAMQWINAKLIIYGAGNFFQQTQQLIATHRLESKIELRGTVPPAALQQLTQQAYLGITLFTPKGLNQYQSLCNRFFDYMMAGIPQVCVDYPAYRKMNDEWGFALLIPGTDSQLIATYVNKMLEDPVLYELYRQNALKARSSLHWAAEESILLDFYQRLLNG